MYDNIKYRFESSVEYSNLDWEGKNKEEGMK